MCTQNNDFEDDIWLYIIEHRDTKMPKQPSDSSLSPLLRALFCVSPSGEWHSGRQCWMALLITSSHAEITTVPANH